MYVDLGGGTHDMVAFFSALRLMSYQRPPPPTHTHTKIYIFLLKVCYTSFQWCKFLASLC